ncbi:relaxase, partial [Vibrio owensii]
VAVSKDLNIVFADKKMEADFVRRKEELKRDVIVETMDRARPKSEAAAAPKEQVSHEATNTQLKEEVLKPAKFEVEYQWDKLSGKLQVTINGKSPTRFEQSTVEQIVKKDTFLKHYTVKEVQFGVIDQKKAAGVQPVPKTYDAQAKVIDKISEQKQSHRMK